MGHRYRRTDKDSADQKRRTLLNKERKANKVKKVDPKLEWRKEKRAAKKEVKRRAHLRKLKS